MTTNNNLPLPATNIASSSSQTSRSALAAVSISSMTSPAPIQLELGALKRDWVEEAETTLRPALKGLGRFSSDDLHSMLVKPTERNWFGVLLASLKNKGLIRRVDVTASRRPEANGRLISVWEAAS